MHLSLSLFSASPSPPRPVLLWATIVVSSWLLPTLLSAANAQTTPAPGVVVGVTTGISNATGQRPSRVNIDDLYNEAGPHWDLYIQALDMFQRVDMTELNSYYQITVLAGHVRKAAKQYPIETVATYTAAAQTFRIPFWDWAQDSSLPAAVVSPTISFNSPSGPATMRNPLYSFQFPNFPFKSSQGGFGGSLAQFNETKRCTLVSGSAAGVSDLGEASSVLTGDGAQLQDKVYAVFTQSTTFETMATMSNAGASFEEPHNVIHDDIACFSVAGHSGHMGDLNWSGFDPVFMLHHANVDRLFAMWQAINFDNPVFTTTQNGNALFGTAAGPVTADSPLRPFYASSSSSTSPVFHTSRSVESMASFGYTYPEINDWSLAPDALASSVRAAVNNLYGPQAGSGGSASSKKKREADTRRSHPAVGTRKSATTFTAAGSTQSSPIRNAPILDTNDYSVEVGVDRSQLPLPCTIELHLMGVASTGAGAGSSSSSSSSSSGSGYWGTHAKIGSTSILTMPQTGTSYSTTPLRRVLVGEAMRNMAPVVFNDSGDVLARLRGLGVVIRTPNGTVVPVASVPSLSLTVQQRRYTPASAGNQFPQYGPVTKFSLTPRDVSM
ncbi:hypothetical protein SCUCBS95973_006625 [Sporothrix curviconia]|uniref:Tyrosinase copper-binding domain-containing protein n=1 Tax=Sporothrix curviconia TaxID=1260050 RepID=A0ABP0C706_9PEZI